MPHNKILDIYGAHKGTLSVVIFFISFVRNNISFVRNNISFVRNIISFVYFVQLPTQQTRNTGPVLI